MAFAQKILRSTFTLKAPNTFAGTGKNTLAVSGLKTQVTVKNAGMFAGCHLDLVVYGMTLSQMNDIAILGIQLQTQAVLGNQVTVEASSDGGENFFTVFIGTVQSTYADLSGMPDAVLRMNANSIAAINVAPVPPTSVNGTVNVATLLQSLATQGGLNFENNASINITIRYPYLWGSVYDQIKELCAAADINWMVDGVTLAIWPKSGSRSTGGGQVVPIVSAATGLVAFPSYTPNGILLKTLFNPAIIFGGEIQVQSTLLTSAQSAPVATATPQAFPPNGVYTVNGLDHELESWVPNGKWFSDIQAINPAYFVVPQ